jgi:hypothetical protein
MRWQTLTHAFTPGGEQARTANGRLWTRLPRAERRFNLAEGQQEMLTGLAVVLGLGVLVLAVLEAKA